MPRKRNYIDEASRKIIEAYCLDGYTSREILEKMDILSILSDNLNEIKVNEICLKTYISNVQKLLQAYEKKTIGDYLSIDRKHREILSYILSEASKYKQGVKPKSLVKAVKRHIKVYDNGKLERIIHEYIRIFRQFGLFEISPYGRRFIKLSDKGKNIAEFVKEVENFLYSI